DDSFILTPPLPRKPGERLHWHDLPGASRALALVNAARQHGGLVLVVVDSSQAAQQLKTELEFFAGGNGIDSLILPDWETLPYDVFSPHQDIVSERLATLYDLPQRRSGILIVPVATL